MPFLKAGRHGSEQRRKVRIGYLTLCRRQRWAWDPERWIAYVESSNDAEYREPESAAISAEQVLQSVLIL